MLNFRKLLVTAVVAVVSNSASAALLTVHATGTITSGYDRANVFGLASLPGIHTMNQLAGLTFTQSFAFETPATSLQCLWTCYEVRTEEGLRVTGKVTVADTSLNWAANDSETNLSLWDFVRGAPNPYGGDQAFASVNGLDPVRGLFVQAGANIRSQSVDFIQGLDFSSSRTFDLSPADMTKHSSFNWYDQNGEQTVFTARLESLSWHITEVPEPGGLGIFVLGAGLLAAASCRRRACPT